jgi:homoserine kinase
MVRPAFRAAPVRIRVPATSANLGPGFDALGLALNMYDDIVFRVSESGLVVDIAGEGADDLRRDRRNLVVRSAYAAFDVLGGKPRGLEVVCANRIPQGRGLGSSAGAVIGGILGARALVVGGNERLDDEAVLRLAVEIEGHPDNVAACLFGGLTLAWTDLKGPRAIRLDVADTLEPVAFVPSTRASTAKVRKLLPENVPHADAVHNAARVALLTTALAGRSDLLWDATEDRLHQSYRAPAMPRTAKLLERLRGAGVPAVVSGAGPTVLALTSGLDPQLATRLAGATFAVHSLEVDREGARVAPLQG